LLCFGGDSIKQTVPEHWTDFIPIVKGPSGEKKFIRVGRAQNGTEGLSNYTESEQLK
jgi:hypothetical protein